MSIDSDFECILEEYTRDELADKLSDLAYAKVDDGTISRLKSRELIENSDSMDKYDIIEEIQNLLSEEEKILMIEEES